MADPALLPSSASRSARLTYSAAGQAASALHSMDAGLDSASLRDLRSATDLALRATKTTAQAIVCSMSSLIVLEHHLWLMMMEMKETDKIPFLNAPVSSGSLFGPAVEGFAERFTEAQKSSQAMRHFLPKRTSSSSASLASLSSRPKSVPTQQTAKLAPTTPQTASHVPPCDLPTILRALKGPPFEPLLSRFPLCQGPENLYRVFCLIEKVRTAFCWLR